MLKEADPSFPEVFFSLDGGIIRESSAAYQFAKEIARCKGWGGFTNLLGGIFGGDMFPSDDVKKIMEMYLLQESSRVPISLYVPETLGICDWIYPVKKSCPAIIDGYRKITQDESWIGLLIWQHKYKADHAKDLAFVKGEECMGCTESGMDREKKEGKKYSNAAYEGSMKKGRRYLEMAPGGRYEIHNAGRRGGISVMWDTSPPGVGETFAKIMRGRRDFRYVGALRSPTPPSQGEGANAARLQGEGANTTQLQGEGANATRLQGENALRLKREGVTSLSGISTTPIGDAQSSPAPPSGEEGNAAARVRRDTAKATNTAERNNANYSVMSTVNLRKKENRDGAPVKTIESRPFYERGSWGDAPPVNLRKIPVDERSVNLRKINRAAPVRKATLSANFAAAKNAAIKTAAKSLATRKKAAQNQFAELNAVRAEYAKKKEAERIAERAAGKIASRQEKAMEWQKARRLAQIEAAGKVPTSVISPEETNQMRKYSVIGNPNNYIPRVTSLNE
jgi:hypothetical protein